MLVIVFNIFYHKRVHLKYYKILYLVHLVIDYT